MLQLEKSNSYEARITLALNSIVNQKKEYERIHGVCEDKNKSKTQLIPTKKYYLKIKRKEFLN